MNLGNLHEILDNTEIIQKSQGFYQIKKTELLILAKVSGWVKQNITILWSFFREL
ncbi:hypothetical protein NIES3585_29880 [Nodularia sp. NIES-3585]|nr:hypothetical protein NIES3585_29880 [Nodularia sp. NIES-3585]